MAAPNWLLQSLLAPVLRPATRLIIGLIAVPMVRSLRSNVLRDRRWDEEVEKDIDQWFRASLILLFATKNMELIIAHYLELKFNFNVETWYVLGGRLLLAIGVVEAMPDQQLFSIIHPGPPKLKWIKGKGVRKNLSMQAWPYMRGVLCQHLNRSSPVLAILAVIFHGTIGWVFYSLAITQYLIIGLVTSRDRALDVLSKFDEHVAEQRQELIDEFHLESELKEHEKAGSLEDAQTHKSVYDTARSEN